MYDPANYVMDISDVPLVIDLLPWGRILGETKDGK